MNGKVHPTDEMTSRQRLLAAYRGEAVDRLPYWAKVANDTWRTTQPRHVRDWSDAELLDYIHADGFFGVGGCVRQVRPHVEVAERIDGNVRTVVTRTPDGDLAERWQRDPTTRSWHPTEFPVKCRRDIGRFRWVYTDVTAEPDDEQIARARARVAEIGGRGITKTGWGTSPLMHLVEHVIGPVNTTYFLVDWPDEMAELIALMHEAGREKVRRVADSTPADVIVSVENTSTTLISPGQFEAYCYRHLCDYGRIIAAAGKMHELHMCGLLYDLLERIDAIPAASIEAFTSPPLANTRMADGRAKAPSKTLVGGTCVNVWWKDSPEDIEAYLRAELDACPDHRRLVVTTAGVAPPACSAETFRAVGAWIPSVAVRN